MLPKNNNGGLSQSQIAIATLLVAVLSLVVTPLGFEDKSFGFTVTLLVVFLILVVGAYFIFANKFKEYVLKLLRDRWNGPDAKKRRWYFRPFWIAWGYVYRFVVSLPFLPAFWVSLIGVVMGGLVYYLFYLLSCRPEFNPQDQRLISLCSNAAGTLAVGAVPFLITWGTFVFSRELYRAAKSLDPGRKTVKEFIRAFDSYKDDFKGKSISQIRREIGERDPGPVLIISVAATDLLCPDYDLFAEAWKKDPTKTFKLLLSDPVSTNTRQRDKRLNGRYLQYYAIPYLRLLFKWYEDKVRGSNRISLHRWTGNPDYRVVLSRDRMVMQRYGRFQHGFQDIHVILHRVHFSHVLENGFISSRCWESLNNQCALLTMDLWDADKKGLKPDSNSIFSQFADNLEHLINNAPHEEFITTWGNERLCRFARYCGLSRKISAELQNWPKELAEAICKHLDLNGEFERVTQTECKRSPRR